MSQLLKNGNPLPERILLGCKRIMPPGVMHPGIAVANVLKILAENSPKKCRDDWPQIVQQAKVNAGFTKLTIDGIDYPLRQNLTLKRDTGIERCLRIKCRKGHPNDEAYFILNPHPQNMTLDRLVVKVEWDRHNLAVLVEDINKYCRSSTLPFLQGIKIVK